MRKAWFTCLLWSDTSVIVVLSAAIRAIKLSGLSYTQRMEDGRAGRDRKRGRFGRRKKND